MKHLILKYHEIFFLLYNMPIRAVLSLQEVTKLQEKPKNKHIDSHSGYCNVSADAWANIVPVYNSTQAISQAHEQFPWGLSDQIGLSQGNKPKTSSKISFIIYLS